MPLHRFVTIEQTVRATLPAAMDLPELFHEWGLSRSTQEAIWVVALDNVENVKTVIEVARGGFHTVEIPIPPILAAVLSSHTDRFYVAHNHPSGPIRPTPEDIDMTVSVMKAANAAGLSFEDHIIVGPRGGWFSFWEEGLLQRVEPKKTIAKNKKGGH